MSGQVTPGPAGAGGKPLVSVWMITYNQAEYVEKAIRSVLSQRADFEIELVIGDDQSTDGTKEICESFANDYPNMVRYRYHTRNVGMQRNVLETYERCTGKYVAMLEGDDEWIDPEKLAKQVRILEDDERAVMCYSNARVNDTRNPDSTFYFKHKPAVRMDRYAVIEHCVVPTCTVVFRNNAIVIPSWFVDARDSAYFLYYLLCKEGDLVYYDEPLAIYNHHYQGQSRLMDQNAMLYSDTLISYELVKYFDGDSRIRDIVVEKHVAAIDHLFHRRAFGLAIRLFWDLPPAIVKESRFYSTLLKQFTKVHFLLFLSRNDQTRF